MWRLLKNIHDNVFKGRGREIMLESVHITQPRKMPIGKGEGNKLCMDLNLYFEVYGDFQTSPL